MTLIRYFQFRPSCSLGETHTSDGELFFNDKAKFKRIYPTETKLKAHKWMKPPSCHCYLPRQRHLVESKQWISDVHMLLLPVAWKTKAQTIELFNQTCYWWTNLSATHCCLYITKTCFDFYCWLQVTSNFSNSQHSLNFIHVFPLPISKTVDN